MNSKLFSTLLIGASAALYLPHANAQLADVTYTVQIDRVISYEDFGGGQACWETGDEEYTAFVNASDNVNGAASSSGCLTCDSNGDCTYGVGTNLHTRSNNSYTISSTIDAWEDDQGNRCVYDGSCFLCNADDCRRQQTASYAFREFSFPSNGTFTVGPTWGSTSDHTWRLRATWRYSGTANLLAPTCAAQNTPYTSGAIRSWSVNLTAGVTYIFDNCSSTSNDTYLRLYGTDGYTVVTSGDDNCGLLSSVTYTAATTGTHYIEIAQYNRGALTTGGTLTYRIAPPTTSSNGGNLTSCANAASASLNGVTPTSGTGTWTASSGTVSFSNVNSPTSTATGTVPGTYTLTWTINNGGCTSASTLQLTVNSLSTAPVGATGTTNICPGASTTLTVQGGSAGTGAVVQWYTGSCGGTLVGTGNSITVSPAATTTYYLRYSGTCNTTTCATVTVNVLAAVAPTATNTSVCPGNSATLLATAAGAVSFNWYANAVGGTPLQSGSSVFTTPPITAATTYYVTSINAAGCESSRVAVTVGVLAAAVPTVSGTTAICPGATTTLTANAAGASGYNWYESSDKTGFLASGASFTTPALTVATTFYVAAAYSNGCESAVTPVTVTMQAAPVAPVAADAAFCQGQTATLTAVGSGGTLSWFNVPTGGASLGTGTTYNAGTPAVGTYAFYVSESNGTCNSPRTPVMLTVRALPAAPTASGVTICSGTSATITATVAAGNTANWYSNAGLTNLVSTGSVFITPALVANTTYFVTQEDVNGCQGTSTSVTVTVTANPANPTVTGATVCAGSTATLTATGVGTLTWYSDAAGAVSVATGASFTTPALTQTTTYYVQDASAGCVSGLVPVTATVTPLPALPNAVTPADFCAGDNVVLTATGSGTGNLLFYNSTMTLLGTYAMSVAAPAQTHNAGALAAGAHTFFVAQNDGTCQSQAAAIAVNVNAAPAAPTVTGASICSGNTAIVTATGTGIQWYSDAGLTNVVGVGNSYTTPILSANTTYFATQTNANGCESASASAVVTVTANPANPTVTGATVCAGNTATLTATGSNLTWYSDATGSVSVGTGNSFTTPALSQTTTYYVQSASGSCLSGLVPVLASVTALPNSPSVLSPVNVCAGGNAILTATGSGSGDLDFYNSAAVLQGSYTMSAAAPTGTFNAGALAVGSYTFSVREDNGTCQSNPSVISVVVNALPAAPAATGVTICKGTSATLTATGTSVQWFADAALTNLVGTGNTFVTPILNVTTDYYVMQTDANGCGSASTMVTVTVSTAVFAPTVTGATVCSGTTATLTATGAGTLTWYSDAAGTTSVATGGTFVTPVLTQTTTYYVEDVVSGCPSPLAPVTATVTPLPNTPAVVSPVLVCENANAVITGTGSGTGDLVFYDNVMTALSNYTMSVAAPSGTHNAGVLAAGTYTFFVTEHDGTCQSNAAAVSVVVNAAPAAPTAINATICEGDQATLSSTGAISWYSDAALSDLLLIGNTFVSPALTSTTNYFFTNTVNGCASASATATVNVNAAPAAPTTTGATVCAGSAATLSAVGAGGTLEWYSDAAGIGLLTTGATLNAGVVSQTTNYYVREVSAQGCEGAMGIATVTVNALPNPPAAGDVEVCGGTGASVSATGSGVGDIIFYDANNNIVGQGTMTMGNPTVTVMLGTLAVGNYVYFASEDQGNCASANTAINVTVNPAPAAPTVTNDGPACEGEAIVLQASSIGGANYQWTGPSGFTSNSQTVILDDITTANAGAYTVNVIIGGCTSSPASTTVVVNAAPAAPGANSNSPLCEGDTLQLDANASGSVTYQWSGPNGFTGTNASVSIAGVTEIDNQGFYNVVVTDANTGCVSAPASLLVMINPVPNAGMVFNNGPVCENTTLELTVPTVFGASYFWTGPNGFTSLDQNPTIADVDAADAGVYTVLVSNGSCFSSLNTTVTVLSAPLTTIIPDTTVEQGNELMLYATGGVVYHWSPDTYLDNPTVPTPMMSTNVVGVYTYSVDILGLNGCSEIEKVTVTVIEGTPTTDDANFVDLFTPNDDGVNDTWDLGDLSAYAPYNLQIMTRGGLRVLQSTNYQNDWDGTFKGKKLPDGAYWYILETATTTYKGAVTIKR